MVRRLLVAAPDGKMRSRSVNGDRAKLSQALDWFAEHNRILVGYNSQRFDLPVMASILAGSDPYPIVQSIIAGDRRVYLPRNAPRIQCDHIDLSARLRRGGSFPSLKTVAANLGRQKLQELPYPPDANLTDEQWEEVKRYNGLDLAHTWALLERVGPDLQALASLSEELYQDLRSTPSPAVVERVFLSAYGREHGGAEPVVPEVPREVLYRPVAGVVRPRTAEAAAWFDQISDRPIPIINIADRPKVNVPKGHFAIGGLRISVGAGGLHSVDEPRVHYATKRHRLVSVDVGSYYPSLIATKGISPAAYGEIGAVTYREILRRRLDVKQHAKDAADPAERERLDIQATGLKLILNSTFGKFGDSFSTLFDPAAMLAVTLSGQLMLIDLIERLTEAGVEVVSANTDGLFIRPRRDDDRWWTIIAEWQRDTEMVLEVEPLKRLAIVATNNYATLDIKGKIKRKGDAFKGSLTPKDTPNSLVVNDAVTDALLRDIPPERTVRICTDPVRFCRLTRRSGKVTRAVLHDETTGRETELPKLARWYRAKGSRLRIVHHFDGSRHTTPRDAIGVKLAMDLPDRLAVDVDFGFYIGQARRTIQKVRGYRHLAPRQLEGHPLALEAKAAGLVPVPKWGGKAQLSGSDPSVPTFLWDWSEITTVGTFTGPAVGILVVDIDEPIPFRLWTDKGNSPLLADRWNDLRGCLVSVHGETTADDVRTGRGRGKLIFRFQADAEHPLARLPIGRWRKVRGVDIFFGKGLPSLLGEYSDSERYRLDGTLGDAPDWLIEGLIPRGTKGRNAAASPATNGNGNGHVHTADPWSIPVVERRRNEPASEDRPEADPNAEIDDAALDTIRCDLATLAPALDQPAVGWRLKPLADGRAILVGRCPFEHDSGENGDADLSLGFDQDGSPHLRCLHQSCETTREINGRLRAIPRRPNGRAVERPPSI